MKELGRKWRDDKLFYFWPSIGDADECFTSANDFWEYRDQTKYDSFSLYEASF